MAGEVFALEAVEAGLCRELKPCEANEERREDVGVENAEESEV